jgi:Fic-DOC domain mobile mystery protein B
MKFEQIYGATPIDPNEASGLIPKHIQTQAELNAFEHLNISLAIPWAFSNHKGMDAPFLKRLHKKMFDKTWKWAGQFRRTQKNIGVEAYRIETELYQLCDDTNFQIKNLVFDMDEIAARFHHRLVFIHPFINGNGRHARLSADILLKQNGENVFSWGANIFKGDNLGEVNEMRKIYIKALKEADRGNIKPLIDFVRM